MRLRILAMRGDNSRGSRRLRHVVVGTKFEASNPVLGFITRGEHQYRHARRLPQRLDEIEAGFARHHHVEDKQVEIQTRELVVDARASWRV